MFKMFSQLWLMFTTFFSAGEHLANAVTILAQEAEKTADGFAKENAIEREKKLKALEAQA